LKAWDKRDNDIKLSSIDVLVLDEKGKIKTHKLGSRSVGRVPDRLLLAVSPRRPCSPVSSAAAASAFHPGASASRPSAIERSPATGGKAAVGVSQTPPRQGHQASSPSSVGHRGPRGARGGRRRSRSGSSRRRGRRGGRGTSDDRRRDGPESAAACRRPV
jgi:hypothetical protein